MLSNHQNMAMFNKFTSIILSFISFSLTVLTLLNFTKFISDFSHSISNNASYLQMKDLSHTDISSTVSYVTKATVIDMSLLCIFMIQHSSLLPLQDIIASKIRLPVLNRSFLNIFTCASLQLLMHCWRPIPQYIFWSVNTDEQFKEVIFKGIHILCWLMIYLMMISMDITDLFGIKQVYYSFTGRPNPNVLKSDNLKHLHKKMRHPSFLCFALIFWIYPYMRLDRLLLAAVWSLYMLMVWRPDFSDYDYVVYQQKAKQLKLNKRDRENVTEIDRFRGF